ncbi:MAG TPA: endonuclease/exonuclease/phosphatase family protein [Vicinamibacterales bacterium]|nr:endonuclease/exonuclease/phosphatase family protein [Vicinamibacterales bacterium]
MRLLNARARKTEQPARRSTAWLRAGLLVALTLAPVAAQEPGERDDRFSPRGTCAGTGSVRWQPLAPAVDREVLDRWCDSVGPPLLVAGTAPPASIDTLVIATWNVHAGNGDVEAFLASVARLPQVRAPYAVVLLLQEVVRASAAVPQDYPARMRPPGTIRTRRTRHDAGALADRLRLHTAYVPSMRNGRHFSSDAREDRGNAILSSFPLDDVRALELPFGQQRHVAVSARVAVPGLPPLRVLSVHLDPSGHRTREAGALAAELRATGEVTVVGGDLNTWFGRREDALKVLATAVPEEDCGHAKTNTWPWGLQWPFGWWRGRLDYLFSSLPASVMRSCQTIPNQFGSDHRPVVMVIDLPTP